MRKKIRGLAHRIKIITDRIEASGRPTTLLPTEHQDLLAISKELQSLLPPAGTVEIKQQQSERISLAARRKHEAEVYEFLLMTGDKMHQTGRQRAADFATVTPRTLRLRTLHGPWETILAGKDGSSGGPVTITLLK